MRHLISRARRVTRRLAGRRDPIIVMYHRVAEVRVDPWRLAVEPRNFEAQIALLASSRSLVPLDWLIERLVEGKQPADTVAITFDDGYRDLLTTAKPILEKHGAPATVFFTTGAFGASNGFWWDRLANSVYCASSIPDVLELSFARRGALSTRGRDRKWVLEALWQPLGAMGCADRELALSEVARVLESPAEADAAIVSAEEARALVSGGNITPGVHTLTHASLPALDEAAQRVEMMQSREMLEASMGAPVRRLAYPFGHFDSKTERLAKELGFDYAVTTQFGALLSRRQRYQLPRYGMENWTAEQLEARLQFRM